MRILFKTSDKDANQNLIDKAPYLSPWYFSSDKPFLYKDGTVLNWEEAINGGGITAMMDGDNNCLALIGMYSYILPSHDNRSFLIWSRSLEKTFGPQSISICYYEVDKLPIIDFDNMISRMGKEKSAFCFSVSTKEKMTFSFNPKEESMMIDFPDDFKKFGEFILLMEMENLYDNLDPNNHWGKTTMLCIQTNTGLIFNYPQDWFNKSDCDFGYQGITRAIKDPKTNLIHGQGIRLSDFILDETNRQRIDKRITFVS